MNIGEARYSWGGDEHLLIELSPEMSLEANFTAMAITAEIEGQHIAGITDVCLTNASCLIRFDPDIVQPETVEQVAREAERRVRQAQTLEMQTRILEIPVWYDDPYTREVGARFRDRHQEPDGTDLAYAARINGFATVQEFIDHHSGAPWIASMVGFVAGLPFLYQMVERHEQIEVPKYLRPRTDTPPLTVGHGGCFGCIYSVRGAGGYQMFGITPVPIFDPAQRLEEFSEFMVLLRPGDIIRFRPIDEDEYLDIRRDVDSGSHRYQVSPVTFNLQEFLLDSTSYRNKLLETL